MVQYLQVTPFSIGHRFIGIKEFKGEEDNPMLLAMLRLTGEGAFDGWPEHDEVPWCSAFLNWVFWLLRLPRSRSLRARSWLQVGRAVHLDDATVGYDVVVLWRGENPPGPDVIKAPGHVGLYAGHDKDYVMLLGGNQQDTVSVQAFPRARILGVRRPL